MEKEEMWKSWRRRREKMEKWRRRRPPKFKIRLKISVAHGHMVRHRIFFDFFIFAGKNLDFAVSFFSF
jgi:hypothetical protein